MEVWHGIVVVGQRTQLLQQKCQQGTLEIAMTDNIWFAGWFECSLNGQFDGKGLEARTRQKQQQK